MTGDIAERNSTASISWRALRSAFSIRSRVTGSRGAAGVRAALRVSARGAGWGAAATSPDGRRAVTAASGRREGEAGLPAPPGSAVEAGGGDSRWSRGAVSPPPFVPPAGPGSRSPFAGGSRSESRRADSRIRVSKMRSKRALFASRRSSRETFRCGGVSSAMSRLPVTTCRRYPDRAAAARYGRNRTFRIHALRPEPGTHYPSPLSRAPARGNDGNHAGTPLPVIPAQAGIHMSRTTLFVILHDTSRIRDV